MGRLNSNPCCHLAGACRRDAAPGSMRFGRGMLFVIAALMVLRATLSQAAETFPLSYSGRLTQSSGAPVEGPVDIELKFFAAETEGTQLGDTYPFTGVTLQNGIFTLSLQLTPKEAQTILGSGSEPVYIEVSAVGRVYPRQRFSVVPFALRVPVDNSSLVYDGVSGKLSINGSGTATPGQILTSDGSGKVRWDSLSYANLSAKTAAGGQPGEDQIITYKAGKWVAGNLADIPSSYGTVTAVTVTPPLNVANPTTTPALSMAQASGSMSGYLSSSDWTAFNAKQAAGSYLTELAGDVIASGPGSGSASLAAVALPGTATKVTFDAKGRVLSGSSLSAADISDALGYAPLAAVSITTGTGLTGGPITTAGTISLASTGVTPGTYVRANVVVDAQGRLSEAISAPQIVDTDIASGAGIAQSKIQGLPSDLASKEPALPSGGNVTQFLAGNKTWQSLTTAVVSEDAANLYYTDARARAALSATSPLSYVSGTGVLSLSRADSVANGYLSSTDWTSFNAKQDALGFAPLNRGGDTMSGALDMNGNDVTNSGNIQIAAAKTLGLGVYAADPTGLGAEDKGKTWYNATANQMKYWDGTAVQVVGAVGAALASLNGQTGATQSFAVPGNTGIAPAWSSAGNVHTLNIPAASATGVTAGLLSNSDYGTFIAKQPAGSYLTNLSGDITSSGFSSGTVATTLQSVALPGTATKLTYDVKGRVTAGTSLDAADLPPHSAGLITSGTVSLAHGGTGANLTTTGGAGQYLKQVTAGGPVTVGTLPTADITNALGYTPANKAGDTMSGALNMGANDLVNTGSIQIAAAKTLGLGVYTADPTGLAAGDKGKTWFNSTANQMKYWDGSAVQVVGAVGAALASLNGQTGATQSFAVPGSTGTAPTWSSAGNVHTINIPLASATGVTAGLLSNSDFGTFNAKQPAGSYVTNLSGDITSSGFSSGTVATTLQSVALPGTATKLTYDVKGRVTAGTSLDAADLPPLSGAMITSGTVGLAYGGTGTNLGATGGAGQYLKQVTAGGAVTVGTLPSIDITNALGYTPANKAGDTMAGALNFGANDLVNAGNIQIAAAKTLGLGVYTADPTGLAAGDKGKTWFNSTANQMKYWDGTAVQVVGAVGAALASLNGQTGATQSFALPGSTGTAPSWSSAGNVHTINIPLASAAGVTSGLLSNSDYNVFNAKQPAGSYVTNLSGDITSSGFSSGTVATTLQSVALPGTATKLTYDVKGRVTAGTSLDAADLPPHSAGLITSGTVSLAHGGTGANLTTTGGAGQYLKQVTAGGPVTVGTLPTADITNALGYTPANKAGDTMAGALNMGANDLVNAGNIQIAAAKTLGLGVYTADPTGLATGDKGKTWFNSTANQMKYWDGTAVQVVGAVGAALASLNGQTGATQSFALPGSTGTAPSWSSTGNVHTINIPLASATGVTAGLLSNTDYSVFTAKQPAGSYLTNLSGDITSSGFSSGTVATTLQSVALPGTATKVTYDAKGRVTSGTSLGASDLPSHSAGLITSGTVGLAYGGTGTNLSTTGGAGQYLKQVTAGGAVTVGTLPTADITNALGYTPANKAGDTMSGALNMGANDLVNTGNIQIAAAKTLGLGVYTADPTGFAAGDKGKTWFNSTVNQMKYWDGTAVQVVGAVGAALASLNGQTGPTQSFALPGSTGTAPSWSSTGNVHTLNIPLASATGVTGGLLSNSDYSVFNAKQPAGNYLTAVTGDITTSGFASGTVTATLPSITTAGTATKVTFDAQGRVTSGTSLAAADLPAHSASLITSGTLSVANGGTGAATLAANGVLLGNGASPLLSVAPGASGNVLTSNGTTWSSATLPATNWAAPGAIGATTPNAGQFTTLSTTGNVGVGVATPSTRLHVASDTNWEVAATVQNPNAGSDALAALRLNNNGPGSFIAFLNSSGRTVDGGANTATLRNDAGALKLQAAGGFNTSAGITVAATSGYVGIGTAAPSALLEVNVGSVAGYTRQTNIVNSSATGLPYVFVGDGSSKGVAVGHTNNSGANSYGWLTYVGLDPTAGKGLIVDAAGNIGIGTTAPDFNLSIRNTTADVSSVLEVTDSTKANFLTLWSGRPSDPNPAFIYPATRDLRIGTWTSNNSGAWNERVRVTSSGNVGIGVPNPSAVLDVSSTTSGFLPPRLTTAQRNAIASPAAGLTIYNATSNLMEMYNGASWVLIGQNMPEGAIMAFASASCPAGWTEYSEAYGRFLRGIDKSGTAIDLSGQRAPGNIQDQDWKGFSMYNTSQGNYSYSHGPVDMGKSTSSYIGNLFIGYWQAPAAALGTKWNTNDEVRPKNVAVLYCRYSGGSGVSVPAGANQVIQGNTSVTVTDSGSNGAVALATEGVDRLNIDANGNVGINTTSPGIALDINGYMARKIWRVHGYNQADGGDNNYVTGRSLVMTKYKSGTSLRVSYTDNMRTYSADGSCRWEVRIDGASCSQAPLAADVYSHGYANVHHNRTFVGYCDTVAAGSHTLAVYVSSTPGYSGVDCFTGWQQAWTLEAEEVN